MRGRDFEDAASGHVVQDVGVDGGSEINSLCNFLYKKIPLKPQDLGFTK